MKWIVFAAYNLAWLRIMAVVLDYFHTYINGIFIPDSLRWGVDGNLREDQVLYAICQYAILNIEALALLIPLYAIDKWYLFKYGKIDSESKVLIWTMILSVIIMFVWVFRHFFFIYK